MSVAVLFAREDSIYYSFSECDVWDKVRDATNYAGSNPIVAHPPCRGWGRMRAFAKPAIGELDLARFAVKEIRRVGGVLEHPEGSQLWKDMNLPSPGSTDSFGGFTVVVNQFDFGHKARKRTWLYICGCTLGDLPAFQLRLGEPEYVVAKSRGITSGKDKRPEISKADRERTPVEFAKWLIQVAQKCRSQSAKEVA